MLRAYLMVRGKSVVRQITEAGWLWAVFSILAMAGLGVVFFVRLHKMPQGGLAALFLSLAALLSLHTQRRDLPFLRVHIPLAYRKLLFVEYLLLSLPFSIVLLLRREFLLVPSLFFCIAFLPWLPQVRLGRKSIGRLFWVQGMELNAQWRLLWLGFAVGSVVFLSGVVFGRMVLAAVGGSIVLSILFFSFHIPENWFYIATFRTTSGKFMYRKIIFCVAAILPVLLLLGAGMAFRFPETTWFVGVFVCSYVVGLINNVTIKYAFARSPFLIQFFQSFNFLFTWAGASVLFTPFVFWQARRKLRTLLDD